MVTAPATVAPYTTMYSWASPAGAPSMLNNATTQTADITSAMVGDGGNYTVTITHGECTLNRVANLTVNARPAVFGPTSTPTEDGGTVTVCETNSLVLRGPAAPVGETYTYNWSGPEQRRRT